MACIAKMRAAKETREQLSVPTSRLGSPVSAIGRRSTSPEERIVFVERHDPTNDLEFVPSRPSAKLLTPSMQARMRATKSAILISEDDNTIVEYALDDAPFDLDLPVNKRTWDMATTRAKRKELVDSMTAFTLESGDDIVGDEAADSYMVRYVKSAGKSIGETHQSLALDKSPVTRSEIAVKNIASSTLSQKLAMRFPSFPFLSRGPATSQTKGEPLPDKSADSSPLSSPSSSISSSSSTTTSPCGSESDDSSDGESDEDGAHYGASLFSKLADGTRRKR